MLRTPLSTHNVRPTVGSPLGAGTRRNVLALHVPRPGPLSPRTLRDCGDHSPRCFPASSTYRSSTPSRVTPKGPDQACSGVASGNLAGRTLRDLVLGRSTALTRLPWVGHE